MHASFSTLASVTLLALLASNASAQATWYVDHQGTPPGSGTIDDPFPTIRAALMNSQMDAGDEILVAPGDYVEDLDSINHPSIALRSAAGPGRTSLQLLQDYLVRTELEGFAITGPGVVKLHGTLAPGAVLRQCVVRGYQYDAVQVWLEGTLIESCTIVENGTGVRGVGFGPEPNIRSSIVHFNDLDVDAWWLAYAGYSVFESCEGQCLGRGNLQVDPELWDLEGGDFHLRPGSPCIDTGGPAAPPDPDGSMADIGAFPYDPTHAPPPQVYCTAAPNSAGAGAHIAFEPPLSITANGFTLHVDGAPPDEPGLFFYGAGQIQVPFGDGFRCVGAGGIGVFRLGPAVATDGAGAASRSVDFTQPPAGAGPGAIEAGSTWSFQFWYRDVNGPLGSGFNLSDALQVGFLP